MDSEQVFELYDLCWFEREIFKVNTKMRNSSVSEENSDLKFQDAASNLRIDGSSTIHRRCVSEDVSLETSFIGDSHLPDSVLFPGKLQTIFSGKEVNKEEVLPEKNVSRKRRRLRTASKSLSELEFEELKGFIDLGFVFTEEDKDSSLVSIIPGLQRLGKEVEDDEEEMEEELAAIARPYLSEAWDVMERRSKRENPLMNWRIPSSGNEIDMKDNLRCWAHTVASTVPRQILINT